MKKILIILAIFLSGAITDRGVYSLGMHLGWAEIERCQADIECYDERYWQFLNYMVWYYGAE